MASPRSLWTDLIRSVSSSPNGSELLVPQLKTLLDLLASPDQRQLLVEFIEDEGDHGQSFRIISTWLQGELKIPLPQPSIDSITQIFKLLRNLCAFSQQVQGTLVGIGLHLLVVRYLNDLIPWMKQSEAPEDLKNHLNFGIQLLGNMGSGNPRTQAVIWTDLVVKSQLFLKLFAADDDKPVGHLVLVAYLFVCNSEERSSDLVRDQNARELSKKLLEVAGTKCSNPTNDETFNFVFRVVKKVIENGLYSELLQGQYYGSQEILVVPKETVVLLKLLDAEVHLVFSEREPGVETPLPLWMSDNLLKSLLDLFKRLGMTTLVQRNMLAPGEEQETETTLVLLGLFSELAKAHHPALSRTLLHLGLAKSVIDLLMAARELKPVTLKTGETLSEDLRTALFGFKATMVKILGNLAFRYREAQDEIRNLQGLQLIMDCTNIDDSNPYIREWCVMAIRNLCENNLECQEIIRSLHIQSPASTPILDELGVQVEITEDGKGLQVKQGAKKA